ncbi:hypothetical protein HPT25_04015 [Bacillus sp. BRMEA1]|uniref:hypothetical protein n=1 Tax=Neobacillus endophyticus TaxID=2738405 RepID=UPI00156357AF|nr:hypothetical protein [Neobacillus endophyticus]NRD76655.1 hypothetical protein [Neobacillus endophyticus]
MSKGYEQEQATDIAEFADVLPFDVELDNDIREWLEHSKPIQLKEYGLSEPDSEEEYYVLLNELSELLMER